MNIGETPNTQWKKVSSKLLCAFHQPNDLSIWNLVFFNIESLLLKTDYFQEKKDNKTNQTHKKTFVLIMIQEMSTWALTRPCGVWTHLTTSKPATIVTEQVPSFIWSQLTLSLMLILVGISREQALFCHLWWQPVTSKGVTNSRPLSTCTLPWNSFT